MHNAQSRQSTRDDFTFVTGNRQLAFLHCIYRTLKPGARARVVLPENGDVEVGLNEIDNLPSTIGLVRQAFEKQIETP